MRERTMAPNDAKRRRHDRRHVKTRMMITEALPRARKTRKNTYLGAILGHPRASWGLWHPKGKHVKTRIWGPSRGILGPPGALWKPSWGILGPPEGLLVPSRVKTRQPNAFSLYSNVFSRLGSVSASPGGSGTRKHVPPKKYSFTF